MVNTRLFAVGVIALVGLLLVLPLLFPYAISGYGGIASNVHSVEHSYPKVDAVAINIYSGGTIATVTPTTLGPIGASGLRLELGQPQYTGDDPWYSNHIEVETDDGLFITDYDVRIAYFDLSFSIVTDGGGILPINDVNFWIEIKENEFDVFTAADKVECYILEVVTKQPAEINDLANVKVSPAAGGFGFDLDAIETKPVPQWILDSGYQKTLTNFKDVRFMVTVESMQPTQVLHMRTENGATWSCQLRALVFGMWEKVSPYDRWKPPDLFNWFDWLNDIFAGLELIVGLAVGVVLSVIILKFVPDKRLALAILLVTWAIVIVGFGFLEWFV